MLKVVFFSVNVPFKVHFFSTIFGESVLAQLHLAKKPLMEVIVNSVVMGS